MIIRERNGVQQRLLRGKIVGDFLKTSRQRAGLTQQELATKLSYSTAQFVSNWERGISLPPLEMLPKLATLCGIPVRTLIDVLYEYQEEMLRAQKKQLIAFFARTAGRARR